MSKDNDIEWDDPSLQEFKESQKYAYITKRALENNHIGFCYREYSDIKIDSGWRFLFGDEDEDYLDNPDNTETLDLFEIVKLKPELSEVVSSRYRSEFEWDHETNSFQLI